MKLFLSTRNRWTKSNSCWCRDPLSFTNYDITSSFKGGFIGVDIFFVISGYLITSIIYKELSSTGSFSFKYFYERRVRRILPALLFVMLVPNTSLLGFFFYLVVF